MPLSLNEIKDRALAFSREVMLVRLLFCLFAEDTTLFEPRGSFRDFIENNTDF
jgi:hypothetical protein